MAVFLNGTMGQLELLYREEQSFLQVTSLQLKNALNEFVLLAQVKVIFEGGADVEDRSRKHFDFGASFYPGFGMKRPIEREIGNGDNNFFVQEHFVRMGKADAAAADVDQRSLDGILHTAMGTGQFYLNRKRHGHADKAAHLDTLHSSRLFDEPVLFRNGGTAAEIGSKAVNAAIARNRTLEFITVKGRG